MPRASTSVRLAFGAAAVLVVVALALHLSNWMRKGTADWVAAVNMVGLLVLVATGALDPPRGRLRLALGVVALLLILPSAILLLLR